MRVSEVCRLVWGDFTERDSGEVQVKVLGKGNKIRVVLVPLVAWWEVKALQQGDAADNTPVFVTSTGTAIDRVMVHHIVKKAATIAGINPKTSTHWLRHAHAQHSLSKGAPIHLVRDSLGHSNISVTNVYLESSPTDSSSNYLGF